MDALITNFSVCIIFRANTSASLLHVWIGGAKLQQILCSSAVERNGRCLNRLTKLESTWKSSSAQPELSGDAYWHLFQQSASVTQGETKRLSNEFFKTPHIINEITQQIVVCKILRMFFVIRTHSADRHTALIGPHHLEVTQRCPGRYVHNT